MPVIISAVAVLIVGGYFLFRRADVRLVLVAAAAALFFVRATQPEVAGQRLNAFSQFFLEIAKAMANPQFVVPICSAMGFAYVCKLTACDAHLVNLLLRPLRHVKWLLIPGGIAVAWLVNSAIVSQTSTVAVVGPVIIPLLLAAGVSRVTAGALLLLGGSMGGELLNPAAVEVTAIKSITGQQATDVIAHMLPYNLLASGTALLVFWLLAIPYERRRAAANSADSWGVGPEESLDTAAPAPGTIAALISKAEAPVIDRVNPFKAAVPVVPIFLLLVVKRLLDKFKLMPAFLTPTESNKIAEQALIATAMLIGILCAGLTSPRRAGHLAAAFFEGAGFAYAHVISVIIVATAFAESIRANGLIEVMTTHLKGAPHAVTAASIVIPWLMATITGTAVGTAPLVINILLPIAMGGGATTPLALGIGGRIGSVTAISAQFGRTSSPVAPVCIMSATLSRTRPIDLVKRVTPPLIAGGAALLIAAIWHSG